LDPTGLELKELRGGTRLRLRVKPGARADGLVGVHAGALKLTVTAAPERGKANAAVLELLGRALDLPASSLELLSGESSQDKAVRVPLAPPEVAARLERRR
jgi:uncharacterized protein